MFTDTSAAEDGVFSGHACFLEIGLILICEADIEVRLFDMNGCLKDSFVIHSIQAYRK